MVAPFSLLNHGLAERALLPVLLFRQLVQLLVLFLDAVFAPASSMVWCLALYTEAYFALRALVAENLSFYRDCVSALGGWAPEDSL